MTARAILRTYKKDDSHWVGDGFLTQSMLPYTETAHITSPFLIAGYNPPMYFGPTDRPKGVGMHPHRGFETVTIVYQGGLTHADTMGNRGDIGPGDVQWMTAARGVQHEEFHSHLINATGGLLEMVQLWVNLPAAYKLDAPRYQTLLAGDIPRVTLEQGGQLRVIAGSHEGVDGPTQTHSPLSVWDVTLPKGAKHRFELPADHSVSLLLLSGKAEVNGRQLTGPETVIFEEGAGDIRVNASVDAHYLVLSGAPLNEPIAMAGPFVMNTEAEIRQAYADFRKGLF
ncbi:pirin family protein [Falsigemmobacter intermedius]|uniref:pirin family protein n=1 Tax=Falsigemmobacter intermedius TaxID=1553448 RepID=UPI003F101083